MREAVFIVVRLDLDCKCFKLILHQHSIPRSSNIAEGYIFLKAEIYFSNLASHSPKVLVHSPESITPLYLPGLLDMQ